MPKVNDLEITEVILSNCSTLVGNAVAQLKATREEHNTVAQALDILSKVAKMTLAAEAASQKSPEPCDK